MDAVAARKRRGVAARCRLARSAMAVFALVALVPSAAADEPTVSDYRVLLEPAGAAGGAIDVLRVTEVITLAPGGSGEVRLELPEGARPFRHSKSLELRGGAYCASPGEAPVRLELEYAIQSGTGTFVFSRALPARVERLLGVAPEGAFHVEAAGWSLTRNVTARDGAALGGRYMFFDASALATRTWISASFVPIAAHNPTGWLYALLVGFLLAAFALLQLALWLDARRASRSQALTRAVLEAQLARLEAARASGQAAPAYADAEAALLRRLLDLEA